MVKVASMVWNTCVVQSESKGPSGSRGLSGSRVCVALDSESAAVAAHRTRRSRDAANPWGQRRLPRWRRRHRPDVGRVTPGLLAGGSDASLLARVGGAVDSAWGRTASGLLPGHSAAGAAVVVGPCRGRSEVEGAGDGVPADLGRLRGAQPAGDAGVFVRRRGVAEAGAVRCPGCLGFVVDHAPGVARRRVVVVAARVPGSCDERGDRQREGVDDDEWASGTGAARRDSWSCGMRWRCERRAVRRMGCRTALRPWMNPT